MNLLTLVDFVDELLDNAHIAEPALEQVAQEVSALDAVLLTDLGAAARDGAPPAVPPAGAEAAQAAVLVQRNAEGARVHAGPAVPALAEADDSAVAAAVEHTEVPALLAAHERVLVTVPGAGRHPVAHDGVLHVVSGHLLAAAAVVSIVCVVAAVPAVCVVVVAVLRHGDGLCVWLSVCLVAAAECVFLSKVNQSRPRVEEAGKIVCTSKAKV